MEFIGTYWYVWLILTAIFTGGAFLKQMSNVQNMNMDGMKLVGFLALLANLSGVLFLISLVVQIVWMVKA